MRKFKSISILQPYGIERPECFKTHRTDHLDYHHIFNGSKKAWSDKNGCWVWLNHDVHMWVHQTGEGREYMYHLKALAQQAWETIHSNDYDRLRYDNAHEQFMHEIGRDYSSHL